jgi:non-ribosomal peptide synthetase component F
MISKLVLREQSFMPAFEWSQGFSPSQTSGRVHERVAIQAAATPEVVAVALGHETLTYQELNARADQLTHFLRAHGIGSSCIVGLHMTRSIELAIAVLAILKAGAAYLPLDPSYPPDRLAFMAKDSAVPMVIVDSKTAGLVTGDHQIISIDEHQAEIRAQPRTALSPIGGSNDLAYVLYTSGSTGQPKGVAMPHQPLANLALHQDHQPLDGRRLFEHGHHDRDGDVVRKVRAQDPRFAFELVRPVDARRVGRRDIDVVDTGRHLAERREQRSVELDRADARARLRERQRERAHPGSDLDDAIAGTGTRLGGDRPGQVRVDQEVLTERFGWLDAVARGQLADGSGPEAAPPLAARGATS